MGDILRRMAMMAEHDSEIDESKFFRWYEATGNGQKYFSVDTKFNPQLICLYSQYAMTTSSSGKWTNTTIPLGMCDSTCGGARGEGNSTTAAGGGIHVGSISGKRYTSGSSRTFNSAYTYRALAVSPDAFSIDLPNFWSKDYQIETGASSITIDCPFNADLILIYDTTALASGEIPTTSKKYFVRVVDNTLLSSMNIRTRNSTGGVSMYLVALTNPEYTALTFGTIAEHTYRVICIKGEPE